MTACINGNYEIIKLLLDNNADVTATNALGNTALIYCFSRLDEEMNVFENKNLCFKMLELLLDYGADIDNIINEAEGLTFLMYFCGVEIELTPCQTQVLLDCINFLLAHGADRTRENRSNKTAFDFAERNPLKDKVLHLLRTVKQKYNHKKKNVPKKIISLDLNNTEALIRQEPTKECKCVVL